MFDFQISSHNIQHNIKEAKYITGWMDSVYVGMWVYGLSLRLRSPENGPQVSLHAEGSSIDRLVTEGAILVPHLLLAGPAQ